MLQLVCDIEGGSFLFYTAVYALRCAPIGASKKRAVWRAVLGQVTSSAGRNAGSRAAGRLKQPHRQVSPTYCYSGGTRTSSDSRRRENKPQRHPQSLENNTERAPYTKSVPEGPLVLLMHFSSNRKGPQWAMETGDLWRVFGYFLRMVV